MLTLHDHLRQLGTDPRARPWTLRLYSGYSASASVREYALFAPPDAVGARAVLSRLHNAILISNPAAARILAPISSERLLPLLAPIRGIHHIGIFLEEEEIRPLNANFDLPSMDVPPPPVATGEGLSAGLDIGGTGMKCCVLRDGVLLRSASAPTWPDGEQGIESLVRRARALLEGVAAGGAIGSLGIGFASPMGTGGRVTELSTVMRKQVGDPRAFDGFAGRVAAGLVAGPVRIFNDLANLGRYLSDQGERRLVRLQIGTSFGGCWIDSNGTVYATEMGRLVVDAGPDAVPHTYLPIAGAVRAYLSNRGVADDLSARVGRPLDPRTVGHALRELLTSGNPAGSAALDRLAEALRGVLFELHTLLAGVRTVQCGGSMLQGPTGAGLLKRLEGRAPLELTIAAQPGHDGAIAAAMAPAAGAMLKGMRRLE